MNQQLSKVTTLNQDSTGQVNHGFRPRAESGRMDADGIPLDMGHGTWDIG